jgi:hypothetical protein
LKIADLLRLRVQKRVLEMMRLNYARSSTLLVAWVSLVPQHCSVAAAHIKDRCSCHRAYLPAGPPPTAVTTSPFCNPAAAVGRVRYDSLHNKGLEIISFGFQDQAARIF